jgi:hypothetical protein
MYSPEGRSARLTLISVLLGAMLGTLVAVLPPTPFDFATTIFTPQRLVIDLQVLFVLLQVFDSWLELTWNGLLRISPFDFYSNFQLFVTTVLVLGSILSIRDFRAWVAWNVAAQVAYMANLLTIRFIRGFPFPLWRYAYITGTILATVYVVCDLYGLLPSGVTLPIPLSLWASVSIGLVVVNLALFTVYLHAYAARFPRPAR